MKIIDKTNKNNRRFRHVKVGQVFLRCKTGFIYICHGVKIDNKIQPVSAVCLENGGVHPISLDEEITILDATLTIRDVNLFDKMRDS